MIFRGLKFSFLFMAVSILQIYDVQATNYYIAENGNDLNDGKSMKTPWKTMNRVNAQALQPGDTIFFHAGHTFSGTLHINHSGSCNAPIVISSYAKGVKPVLKGTMTIDGFEFEGNNMYSVPVENNVELLYHNDQMLTMARYPNNGFLTMDGGGIDHFYDEIPYSSQNLIGATLRLRPVNWIYQTRTIEDVQGKKIIFDQQLFNTFTYTTTCKNGWGYYLENKPGFLDQHGEWYYNKTQKKVFLYFNHKLPDGFSVEASITDHGMIISHQQSNLVIDNLRFTGYKENAITAVGENENITIVNCTFDNIYKMAIQGGLFCSRFMVNKNLFRDIYGRGISFLESNNCRIENNQMKRIGTIPGYGIDGLNGGIGILLTNREKVEKNKREASHNNYIGYNTVDSTGYISIRMDGYNSTCEFNFLSNALLTLNDGAMIYCWGNDSEFTHHNVIRNNIVSHAHGNTEGTPSDHKMNIGIYIDNRAHHIKVLDNIVQGVGAGIHVNDGSYNNLLKGNVLYGNMVGISFAEFNKRNNVLCENNTCVNNIVFNTHNIKHTLSLKHTYEPDFNPGIIDSNIYVSPYEVYHIKKETMEQGCKIIREHTFDSWVKNTIHDNNSRFVDAGTETKSILLVNKTDEEKEFPLEKSIDYIDLNNEVIKNEVRLKPFTSKILLFRFE